MRILKRTNKTSPRPDSVPFLLFQVFAEETVEAWVKMIQEAGEDMEWESEFLDVLLVLLPKVEGAPRPRKFWLISITNSDYRVVSWYWVLWLVKEVAVQEMTSFQMAVVKGRTIEDTVEIVVDCFMKKVGRGGKAYLLQTDFSKAFDFLNREAILRVLEGLNILKQVRALASRIFKDTHISFACTGCIKTCIGRTGVKQGCLISPPFLLHHVRLSDLLVQSVSKVAGVDTISAYVDNLGIVTKNPNTLKELEKVFMRYESVETSSSPWGGV